MDQQQWQIELAGRTVCIDQARQRITLLDEHGTTVFSDFLQVAAGSLQGLFSVLEHADVNAILNG